MPDTIEGKIRLVLNGESLNDSDDLCDFTLAEQNEAIGKKLLEFIYGKTMKEFN